MNKEKLIDLLNSQRILPGYTVNVSDTVIKEMKESPAVALVKIYNRAINDIIDVVEKAHEKADKAEEESEKNENIGC